jgi:hypothetical protein
MALARRTDKATSHEAAASVNQAVGWQLALGAVKSLQAKSLFGNATANEAAAHAANVCGAMHESVRKRINELVRAGQLQEVEIRKCEVTGKSATAYRVVRSK